MHLKAAMLALSQKLPEKDRGLVQVLDMPILCGYVSNKSALNEDTPMPTQGPARARAKMPIPHFRPDLIQDKLTPAYQYKAHFQDLTLMPFEQRASQHPLIGQYTAQKTKKANTDIKGFQAPKK